MQQRATARGILRRVGTVLLVLGFLDAAAVFGCLMVKIPFGSSLFPIALIGGFLIRRGSLRAAAILRWLAAAIVTACLLVIAASSALLPPSLLLTAVRLHPLPAFAIVLYLLVLITSGAWIVRESGRTEIFRARSLAKLRPQRLRTPLIAGAAIAGAFVAGMVLLLGGARARHAEELAKQQFFLGDDFQYRTTYLRFHWSGDGRDVLADVTAWSDDEIRIGRVFWHEP